jgi:hypothetical protein
VEQVALLGDHADRIGEAAERDAAHVLAVEPHRAAGRVVQPRHQVRDGRLAGAARADQRGQHARLDAEADAAQRPAARPVGPVAVGPLVGEPDVVQLDLAAHRLPQRPRAGGVDDLGLHVQVGEDALEECQ